MAKNTNAIMTPQIASLCNDTSATPVYLNITSSGRAADYWSSALGVYKRGVKRHNGRPVYTQTPALERGHGTCGGVERMG